MMELDITIKKSASTVKRKATVKARSTSNGIQMLLSFTSPPDVRGVNLLVRNSQNMYIYLPALRKTRRIAGSSLNSSFMGTDFSYADILSINSGEVIKSGNTISKTNGSKKTSTSIALVSLKTHL